MNPTLALAIDRTTLGLTDQLVVTITIDAPTITTVTPAKPLLAADSAALWHIRPLGTATVTKTVTSERWSQQYRLDPYQPGEAVPLTFAPFAVVSNNRTFTLEIPSKTVVVTSSIQEVTVEQSRPLVGFEQPPPSPPEPFPWLFLLIALAIVVGLSVWRWRRVRMPDRVDAVDWLRQLEVDLRQGVEGVLFAERMANGVRSELMTRHQVPANCRTTAELLGIADPTAAELLMWCDGVKFAREEPTRAMCELMLQRANEWRTLP